MKRILFVTQTFPRSEKDISGTFVYSLAKSLDSLGLEVDVLAPHTDKLPYDKIFNGLYIRFFKYAFPGFETIGYGRSLRKDIKVKFESIVVLPFYLKKGNENVKLLARARRYDFVHVHWPVPNLFMLGGVEGAVGLSLHGSDVFLTEKLAVSFIMRRWVRKVSFVASCSPELLDRFTKTTAFQGMKEVIPYGVDSSTFSPNRSLGKKIREKLGISSESVVILALGRMVEKKGFEYLARIVSKLAEDKDVHVIFAGDGELLNSIKKIVSGNQKVHFVGKVLRDEIVSLYNAADIFVMPSIHDSKGNVDGLPNVILEAMATGLPVVATRVSGIPLAVKDGVNGFLVKEKDSEAIFEKLRILIHNNALRKIFADNSRKIAVSDFGWETIAKRYYDLYLSVTNNF